MRIRTTRQAREIRQGIKLGRDQRRPSLDGRLYQYPLMQRAYTRTKGRPPAGADGQLRTDHPDRKKP